MADELGIETVEPLVEGMSWGTGAPWKWSSAPTSTIARRSRRPPCSVGLVSRRVRRFRSLMCGEIGFLAVIGFLSGMPRGKTPGRVFLRFRNGERNRAQTAKARSRRTSILRLVAQGRVPVGCALLSAVKLQVGGRPFCVACVFARSAGQSPSSMWWALSIRSPICCDFCNIL